ncbi:MAG: twin-arginine translocase TatA/TatE family subunit [Fibrobacterota bacterium]|nr:twin-arginine translocase TatA/TatE family subunit [Fibrobacterota bacterium]QQS04538.1 MAG: twin-arginine translocase TatA/TatE family subunit [Fibrobacterota bacterium]
MGMIGGFEWVIILVIVLLLFGPSKLPQLAKGLGQSVKEFRDASKKNAVEPDKEKTTETKPEGSKEA